MTRPRGRVVVVVCALATSLAACASRVPAPHTVVVPDRTMVEPARQTVPATPAPVADPVSALIATSTAHFETGQRELASGHLAAAKTAFNHAVDVILDAPTGARGEPRLREHFDRLVERITAYEVTALAQGDGFTEKRYQAAPLDELLALATFEAPAPTSETERAVANDLASAGHDIDIPLNGRVLSYVELFSGRLKNYLQDGLSRGAPYLPMIQEVFRAEGLPLDLAYVPLVESAFKTDALSRASAKGMWQFMRGTGIENGLKHDWYIDERADPEKATRAAAKYLKTLYGMFGDWHLALASYNGGPGRVQKAMKRAKDEDFWSLSATTKFLPRETRDYVPLILAAMVVAKNPTQYGLDVRPVDAIASEHVALAHAVDLRRIAEWSGTSVQTIQALNPELRRWTTPLKATNYLLRVPTGTAELVSARLATADPDELVPLNRHTVRKGETLLSIARKLNVSRADLADANDLSLKAKLAAGQQLLVPRAPTLLLTARADSSVTDDARGRTADAVSSTRSVSARSAPGRTPVTKTARADAKQVHRVKRGDTLSSIARLYRTTVASVKAWNGMRDNVLKVGQRLTILTARSATVATN